MTRVGMMHVMDRFGGDTRYARFGLLKCAIWRYYRWGTNLKDILTP
jgi:hypothetical protein